MTTASASKLDTEKFRKVHGLMTGGATAGERAAAKARAEAMAKKAGMSLKDAVSNLDARPAAKPRSIFDQMMDADPDWRASHDAWMSERERKHAELRAEALDEFGDEEAVFAETDRERRLREVLEPFADWGTYSNSDQPYITGYAGWRVGRVPTVLVEPLLKAYPWPADLAAVWQEYREWDRLLAVREAFASAYDFPPHVRIRRAFLESALDTLPEPTFEGMGARLDWLRHRVEHDLSHDVHDDLAMVDAMRLDFAILRRTCATVAQTPPVQNGRRTNAEKRDAVLSMLDTEPGLSDREIGRRVGVSPQTVNNWRKRRSAGA